MVCVASGNGMIHTHKDILHLFQGNIVLIPPDVKHVLLTDSAPMFTFELKFDLLDDSFTNLFDRDDILFCESHKEIYTLFQKIIQEAQQNNFLAEDYVTLLFSQILIHFARFLYSNEQNFGQNNDYSFSFTQFSDDRLVKSIKMYIEENSEKKLRAEDIAATFFLSTSSIYRKFIDAYHISPMQYLTQVRLKKAKQLLEASDYSITEISSMVGFSSIHSFSKCFSENEKISPATYRSERKSSYSLTYNKPANEYY